MPTTYLHSMIRVTDPDATVAFFKLIGLEEVRRFDSEAGRFTLIFLAAPGQAGLAEVELTHNWPPEDGASKGLLAMATAVCCFDVEVLEQVSFS